MRGVARSMEEGGAVGLQTVRPIRLERPAGLAGQRYELAIYDLSGRRVRVVETGVAKAGRFSLRWDLRDENHAAVAGGV